MAYVYRHIRLDKNEPFYIGIGDDNYKRPYKKSGKTKYWKHIAKNGYEVEIIMDGLTWEQACEKEKEFIILYGRKDLGNGILVNMTDGGDGVKGKVVTDETKLKISNSVKEWHKTYTPSDKFKEMCSMRMSILNKDKDFLDKRAESVRNSQKLKDYYASRKGVPSGYKHTEETKKKMSQAKIGKKMPINYVLKKSKKLIQKTLDGEVVKIWESAKEVQRCTNFAQANISRCCNGVYKQSYGFKWEYYNK